MICVESAKAWEFEEHEKIGREAYAKACENIEKRIKTNKISETKYNLFKFFEDVVCLKIGNTYYYAPIFGQACALAGDHIDSPGEFSSKFIGRKTSSIKQYLKIALINSDHFHPHSPRLWREYHKNALEQSEDMYQKQLPEALINFEKALYTEAFAQHYLHDSFSSGHMGFNREASGVTASKIFHDYWNI